MILLADPATKFRTLPARLSDGGREISKSVATSRPQSSRPRQTAFHPEEQPCKASTSRALRKDTIFSLASSFRPLSEYAAPCINIRTDMLISYVQVRLRDGPFKSSQPHICIHASGGRRTRKQDWQKRLVKMREQSPCQVECSCLTYVAALHYRTSARLRQQRAQRQTMFLRSRSYVYHATGWLRCRPHPALTGARSDSSGRPKSPSGRLRRPRQSTTHAPPNDTPTSTALVRGPQYAW